MPRPHHSGDDAGRRWLEAARRRLAEAGHRSGGARRRVLEVLAAESCAVTAQEIERRLPQVGRASIYRALEQLEQLRLIQRVETGGEAAAYERLGEGQHHHHLVCESCGALEPFADRRLETAIEAVIATSDFDIEAHDVVLKGSCPACADA